MTVTAARKDAFWAKVDAALRRAGHSPATAGELMVWLPMTDPAITAARIMKTRRLVTVESPLGRIGQ